MFRKKNRSMEINGRMVQLRPERYYWSDFFMALPAVLLLVLITYYPVAELIRISFTASSTTPLPAYGRAATCARSTNGTQASSSDISRRFLEHIREWVT